MSRSHLFNQFKRLVEISKYADQHQLTSKDAVEKVLEREKQRYSRREFLVGAGAGLSVLAFGGLNKAFAANLNVGIVGAGLAGLTAGYELKKAGVLASIYEASNRVGGRQSSLRNHFPGQVAERGGELIDSLHLTMRRYAREFNLELEDLSKEPGEVKYFFNNQLHDESVVVDEFREFVSAMRGDLNNLSGEVSADYFTEYDRQLDNTSLEAYLNGANSRGMVMSPIGKEAIIQAYIAEYGLAASEQSALNFLFFIHSDRRAKFQPFGVFSNERYHVRNGNDSIASNIAQRLPNQIQTGMTLVRVAKTSSGRIELTFKQGNSTVVKTHDAVVMTIPFSVLKGIELHSSLGMPAWKTNAIQNLGYGTNAKMMVGFNGRPWYDLHNGSGASYSNLANHQATWETNHANSSATRAIITDYSSAARGANIDTKKVQLEAEKFLTDFNKVFPGSKSVASKNNKNDYIVHLEHWPSNPLSKGSYTAYRPGQFTTIHGNEGKAIGNLLFAGEHTDSFYSWQGFMEGACLSGLKSAADLLSKK